MEREIKLETPSTTSTRKNACIVTFTHGSNYGCELQRYAMQETLRSRSLETKFIVYNPVPEHEDAPPRERPLDAVLARLTFRRKPDVWKKIRRFEDFRQRFFYSTERLTNYAQVEALRDSFDVFVAGSDQIWNPIWAKNDEYYRYYAMEFAPRNRKISYAASLGVSELSENVAARFRTALDGYAWICVREREGAEALKRAIGRDVDVALDPTLLLPRERWDAFADLTDPSFLVDRSYVLCYSLANRRKTTRLARLVRKAIDAKKLLYVCSSDRERRRILNEYWGVTPIWGVDPCEFAALVRDAAYVVTDSFHASVFASIFHRPFLTLERDSGEATSSMNSRLSAFFSAFGMESRRVLHNDLATPLNDRIETDYTKYDAVWKTLRDESLQKLDRALELVLGKYHADVV